MGSFASQRDFLALKAQVYELMTRVAALEGHADPEEVSVDEVPAYGEDDDLRNEGVVNRLYEILPAPMADLLVQGGFTSLEAAQAASDDELRAINGVGPGTVAKIRDA